MWLIKMNRQNLLRNVKPEQILITSAFAAPMKFTKINCSTEIKLNVLNMIFQVISGFHSKKIEMLFK